MKRKMMVFSCVVMILIFFEQNCFAFNVLTKKEISLVLLKASATKRLSGALVIMGAEKADDGMVFKVHDRFGHAQNVKKIFGGEIVATDYSKTGFIIPEGRFNDMIARQKKLVEYWPFELAFDHINYDGNQYAYIVTGHDSTGKLRVLRTIK